MERFLPNRHLIDSFGNGGFRMGGVSHHGSILVTPSGMRALPITKIAELQPQHMQGVLAEKAEIDMLLISTGHDAAPLPVDVRVLLRDAHVGFEVMTTNAAVRTYNVVLAEDRRVAAVLIAVENAHA